MFDVVFVTRYRDSRSFWLAQQTVATGLRGAGRILAVVPDAELPLYERLPLAATVVPESRLDPRIGALDNGWFKQQLVKLCVHQVIEQPAALILDSDVYLCRPVDATELLHDGKTPFYVEDQTGATHPEWRAAAEAMLDHESHKQWSYFPTPNFVHREGLQALHEYLGELWGEDPIDGLVARLGRYTEWQMYGLFVDELMAEDSPHVLREPDHVLGLWDAKDFEAWNPGEAPAETSAELDRTPPLIVVQSMIGAPWPAVIDKLRRYPHVARCMTPEVTGEHA